MPTLGPVGDDERDAAAPGGRRVLHRVTEPLPVDPVRPVVLGTLTWLVVLVVLLVGRDALAPDHRWWTWTAVAGVVCGVLALGWALGRRRRRQTGGDPVAPSPAEAGASGSTGPGSTGPGSTGSGSTGSAASSGSSGSGSVSRS